MITLHERNGLPNLAAEDALPIVDAHHHLWDLGNGRYPWLQDDYHEDFFSATIAACAVISCRKTFLP